MTTNAIRITIISRILRMDRAALLSLQGMMDQIRRSAIPADLPEWSTTSDAADLLHLTPRHVRRLAKSMLPGLMCLRPDHCNQKAWYIHRDLIRAIANAPRRATQAPNESAKPPKRVRMSATPAQSPETPKPLFETATTDAK